MNFKKSKEEKMKITVLKISMVIIVLLLSACTEDSTSPKNNTTELVWQKTINLKSRIKESNPAYVDQAGNVYLFGIFTDSVSFETTTFYTNHDTCDVAVAKYNSNGSLLWAKQIKRISGTEKSYSITADQNGNCYLSGWFNGKISIDSLQLTSQNNSDGNRYILKLNAQGNLEWIKNITGVHSNNYFIDLVTDKYNNCYASGSFFWNTVFDTIPLDCGGGLDVFTAKIESTGKLNWIKQIKGDGVVSSSRVAVDDIGNVFVSGTFSKTAMFDNFTLVYYNADGYNREDSYIAKIGAAGSFEWVKQIKDQSFEELPIIADNNGGCYASINFQDSLYLDNQFIDIADRHDVCLAKYNHIGHILWHKEYGSVHNESAILNLTMNSKNEIFAACIIKDENLLPDQFLSVIYDNIGNAIWSEKATYSPGNDYSFGKYFGSDADGNLYTVSSLNEEKLLISKYNR